MVYLAVAVFGCVWQILDGGEGRDGLAEVDVKSFVGVFRDLVEFEDCVGAGDGDADVGDELDGAVVVVDAAVGGGGGAFAVGYVFVEDVLVEVAEGAFLVLLFGDEVVDVVEEVVEEIGEVGVAVGGGFFADD